MQKRENIRTCLIITISVVIILCICIIVYFVNIIRELNARYKDSAQTIYNIETEIHKLKDKYDQLEREIHATKLMVSRR